MAKHNPPAVKPPEKKAKKPAIPEPGPDDAGKPWCPGCKRYHEKPASKAEWAAAGMKCANPYPAPKPPRKESAAARDRRMIAQGRLPDGSAFAASYAEAPAPHWRGTLSVPRQPGDHKPGPKVFAGEAPGVFGLMKHLDNLYRVWAARPGNTPTTRIAPPSPAADPNPRTP